jgi:DNA-binding NarL/FixJ family response regulator
MNVINSESPEVEVAGTESPINVWLVDDNRRLRQTMTELFEGCPGIRCTATFHSPNAVLSALASRVGPDVILLDLHLGDHNGLEVIRPIKSLARSTHVLMFTTFFDFRYRDQALESGATDFLLKSFPLEKIATAIRQAWNRPVPHLKVRPASPPAPSGAAQADHDHSIAREVGSSGAEITCVRPAACRRLAWVKHCLDLIRAARN